ncbi:MAG: Ig-like domain-containing protein [Blastocatellia bacterium]|nr:Ig-like domain-containing protein [Blastocatellia bacterium]
MIQLNRFSLVFFFLILWSGGYALAQTTVETPPLQVQKPKEALSIKQRNPVVNEGNQIGLTAIDAAGKTVSNVTWASGSPDIAQVDPKTGTVTGVRQGFATITTTNGTDSSSVFVVVARIQKGNGDKIPGDSKSDPNGRLYISSPIQNVILQTGNVFSAPAQIFAGQRNTKGRVDGEAKSALFAGPTAIAIDNSVQGGLYVADTLNHCIRRIGFNQQVEKFLGDWNPGQPQFNEVGFATFGQTRFSSPRGIATDGKGNLFLADTDNHAVYYIQIPEQRVVLLAGKPGERGTQDGVGRSARFFHPAGLSLSTDGRVLAVADEANHQVRLLELTYTAEGIPQSRVTTISAAASNTATLNSDSFPGPLKANLFFNPQSVSFDTAGNVQVVDQRGVYVITQPLTKPQVVNLAQPGVSFRQAVSVSMQGTRSIILDAAEPNAAESVKIVTVGAPEIASLNQDLARLEGGTKVRIAGKNFAPETLLFLGDTPITKFEVVSATQIHFTVPSQRYSGNRTLTVQTRGGIAQIPFRIIPEPLADLKKGEVTTFVGSQVSYVGDGGMATADVVGLTPHHVAVDALGNLFIADTENHRIRRVDAQSGSITTVAGNGAPGFSGDNGLALGAGLFRPAGLAFDSQGRLFVADFGNNRVRRIDLQTGLISTVAGTGDPTPTNSEGLSATSTNIASPVSVALDRNGNLFIGTLGNHAVLRVDAQTNRVSRLLGSGDYFPNPLALTVDASGNLYIADSAISQVLRWDAKTETLEPFAGSGIAGNGGDSGLATAAQLLAPAGLAIDGAGNLLIADSGNHRIRRVDTKTGIIAGVAGRSGRPGFSGDGESAILATFNTPLGIAFDGNGNLYIADSENYRVRQIRADSKTISTIAGSGEEQVLGKDGLATSLSVENFGSLAVDSNGNLFLTDVYQNRVFRVENKTGTFRLLAGNGQSGFAGDGSPASQALLHGPNGIQLDEANQKLFIGDSGNNRIRSIDLKTGIITTIAGTGALGTTNGDGDGGPALAARFGYLGRLGLARNNLLVLDVIHANIRSINLSTGIITRLAGTGLNGYSGDGGNALEASLNRPTAVATDRAGNIFVADTQNNLIRKINPQTGVITTVAGKPLGASPNPIRFSGDGGPATEANLFAPVGVTVDGQGHLFIADSGNNRIRRVDAQTGIITTVAGNGIPNRADDRTQPALQTPFLSLGTLAIDATGNLYVTDGPRVRVIKKIGEPLR